jgi:hypothetical protein
MKLSRELDFTPDDLFVILRCERQHRRPLAQRQDAGGAGEGGGGSSAGHLFGADAVGSYKDGLRAQERGQSQGEVVDLYASWADFVLLVTSLQYSSRSASPDLQNH